MSGLDLVSAVAGESPAEGGAIATVGGGAGVCVAWVAEQAGVAVGPEVAALLGAALSLAVGVGARWWRRRIGGGPPATPPAADGGIYHGGKYPGGAP